MNLRRLALCLGLTLIAALASTGCAATLTSGGETVQVVESVPSDCSQITHIDVEAKTYREAVIEARNLAADAEANRLIIFFSTVDDEYGADLSATAFRCG